MTVYEEAKKAQKRVAAQDFITRRNRQRVNPIRETISVQQNSVNEALVRMKKRDAARKLSRQGKADSLRLKVAQLAEAGAIPELPKNEKVPEPVAKSLAKRKKKD